MELEELTGFELETDLLEELAGFELLDELTGAELEATALEELSAELLSSSELLTAELEELSAVSDELLSEELFSDELEEDVLFCEELLELYVTLLCCELCEVVSLSSPHPDSKSAAAKIAERNFAFFMLSSLKLTIKKCAAETAHL